MRVLLCVFVHVCVCVSLYLIVRERGTHREIPSVKQPVPPLGGARGSPQRLLAVLLQVCSCELPDAGRRRKERFRREGPCHTFNNDRDGWTLVSEQPAWAAGGSACSRL